MYKRQDLTKADDVLEACKGMDLVVHAGALSTVWGPWEDFYQANVLGTKYVLEGCRQTGIQRLVYVSSPSIYAAPKDQLAIKESDAPEENNLNNYICSKLASEKLFKDYPDCLLYTSKEGACSFRMSCERVSNA